MAGLSVTRALGDLDGRHVEARCRNRQPIRSGVPACADRAGGLGRMLGRYTTECLSVTGAEIELKCPICNQMTVIRSS